MPLPLRPLAVGLVGVLAGGVAVAQPPPAPPPVPTLREVVKEYQRLGLPLPPADAPLVRIEVWRRSLEDSDRPPARAYLLGFRLPPQWPGGDPRYWCGSAWATEEWYHPESVAPAAPTPEALHRTADRLSGDTLAMAVACRLRGWDDLAERLYARARQDYASTAGEDDEFRVIDELRVLAFEMWQMRLAERGTDRASALRQLKALVEENEWLQHPTNGFLLSALETTLTHPGSPAGTVDALIDGLTEYWEDWDFWVWTHTPANPAGQEAYWRLAERGFEAVPALIDHLRDDRLTRVYHPSRANFDRSYHVTVGHLVGRLLQDLSGGAALPDVNGRVDPADARKWFAAAREVGEERWLLDHAVPPGGEPTFYGHTARPIQRLIGRVLAAKYPHRLPEVYRAALRWPASSYLEDYTAEVAASPLPRERKLALFEEGLAHDEPGHRLYALKGLAALDPPQFRVRLGETLRWLADGVEACPPWFEDSHPVVGLVIRSGDPACWDGLADLARRGGPDLRYWLVRGVGFLHPPDLPDPARRERVRFLVRFLDDRTVEDDDWFPAYEIRDRAALLLADRLRFRFRLIPADGSRFEPDDDPVYRAALREAVRAAAERELTRPRP